MRGDSRREEFDLTDADRSTITWQKLYDHYKARLDTMREYNDREHDPTVTSMVRVQIKEIKRFLDFNDPEEDKRR